MAGVLHASLNARYQDPVRGQFISEDPNFLIVGAPDWVTGMPADRLRRTQGLRELAKYLLL